MDIPCRPSLTWTEDEIYFTQTWPCRCGKYHLDLTCKQHFKVVACQSKAYFDFILASQNRLSFDLLVGQWAVARKTESKGGREDSGMILYIYINIYILLA